MSAPEPPLYVDLDGTLVSTDLLYESFVSAFRASPAVVLLAVGWLLQGRARLKEELAARASIDVATLPYREPVLEFLREERARGRRLVLATASWTSLAESVARHLGLFDEGIATSREGNVKGEAKAERIAARSADGCFDYLGDSGADIAIWRRCRNAYVVGKPRGLEGGLPASVTVRRVFASGSGTAANAALRAMRPHQWAKNLLVFFPLIASHRFTDPSALVPTGWAFVAFCLLASGAYLVNDLLDLGADRAHPRKRLRPLAAGDLGIPAGALLSVACVAGGMAIASRLPALFQVTLLAYFFLTLAYSLRLKALPILDVISLASLYTLRILAGGFAIDTPPSAWLLVFAMFIFFSLALVKRYAELVALETQGGEKAPGRGYAGHDLEVILALGSASALVSALVLALYVNGESAKELYSRPGLLWLLCPILLYWISRIWLLAARAQMDDDPVLFAVRDSTSYFTAAAGAAVIFMAK